MQKTIVAMITGVTLACSLIGQERGNLVFSDSFDTSLTFAENWVPGKGWVNRLKSEGGSARFPQGGELNMRRDTPANFYAEMELSFGTKDNPQGNSRAGFVIDGKYFLISPEGRIFGWRGEAIDGFETGKPVKLTLIRQCSKMNANYVFLVNGKEVKREVAPLPEGLLASAGNVTDAPIVENPEVKPKPLGIFVYTKSVVVDNFRLFTLKDGAVSRQCDYQQRIRIRAGGLSPEHFAEAAPLIIRGMTPCHTRII